MRREELYFSAFFLLIYNKYAKNSKFTLLTFLNIFTTIISERRLNKMDIKKTIGKYSIEFGAINGIIIAIGISMVIKDEILSGSIVIIFSLAIYKIARDILKG